MRTKGMVVARTKVIPEEWVERAVSSLRELVRLKINVYPVGGLRRLDGRYDSTCKYISSPEEL